MEKQEEIKISLPNDPKIISIPLNAINTLARIQGFISADIQKIEIASEEAISNVLKHAFEPGESTNFEIILKPDTLGLHIIIKEKGIPFDPSLIQEFQPGNVSDKGLGTYLMKQLVDKVKFINLGKEGKETHLYKYINTIPIDERIDNQEIKDIEKEKNEEILPKGSVHFQVRRMISSEAIDISKGAYSSYGYSYVLEHIYFPERVREMNIDNKLISYVAVTDEQEVISHCALEVEDTDPMTPQLGVAFTKPKYRGQGCLNMLADACIEDAKNRKFYGIYARGVTTHPYSQKSLLKFGMNDCAILISSGASREYKGLKGHAQRESVVIHFRYMQTNSPLIIFPPKNHAEIINKIYNHIGRNVIIQNVSKKVHANYSSEISIETDFINQVGKIRVLMQGKDLIPLVIKNLKQLCINKMETIYLYLQLKEKNTAIICSEFEKHGFFFSGIMPSSGNNDFLILQYLNNHIIDYSKIQIASEFGKELLAYINKSDSNLK